MTTIELIAAVRAECGKLPVARTTELEDTDISRESVYILDKIADACPQKAIRSITSVANQREYSVDAATIRVSKVFPWDAGDEELMVLGSIKVDQARANEYYNFPSLWVIEQSRRRRGLPRIRHRFDPVSRKLAIDPYPQTAGVKYWYVSIEKTDWTLVKLPTNFENLLVTGTTWKCLEIVALKRSELGGTLRQGGFIDYPSVSLRSFIDAKKKEFDIELEVKSKLYCT